MATPIDDFLSIGLRTRTPGLLMGKPGVGKTATIQSWARKHNLSTWVVIASLREPTDFAGLPVVSKSVVNDGNGNRFPIVNFAPPRFAAEAAKTDGGLIFLDEISTAPPATQAALLRAVLDLAFGDLELDPNKVAIIAAANPPELAAGGWDLAPPLANRFRHRQFEVDASSWTEEFPTYWNQPPDLGFVNFQVDASKWAQARSMIAGFLRVRPTKLCDIPKEESARGKAWPSPRTWDFASRQLAAVLEDGQSVTNALPYIADCVGEGCAYEFMTWSKQADLPDPWDLLANPKKFKPNPQGDIAFATLSAIVSAAITKMSPKVWTAAWELILIAANAGQKDIAAIAVRTLFPHRKSDYPLPSNLSTFKTLVDLT